MGKSDREKRVDDRVRKIVDAMVSQGYKEKSVSESKQVSYSGGVGFFGLLGIVFITLKLMGYIDWAWWLVLLPLWGPCAGLTLLLVVIALCLLVAAIVEK